MYWVGFKGRILTRYKITFFLTKALTILLHNQPTIILRPLHVLLIFGSTFFTFSSSYSSSCSRVTFTSSAYLSASCSPSLTFAVTCPSLTSPSSCSSSSLTFTCFWSSSSSSLSSSLSSLSSSSSFAFSYPSIFCC